MTDFFQILSQFGFPIAVASYLLFRFEKKLETLWQTNEKLVDIINSLKDQITNLITIITALREKVVKLESIIKILKRKNK